MLAGAINILFRNGGGVTVTPPFDPCQVHYRFRPDAVNASRRRVDESLSGRPRMDESLGVRRGIDASPSHRPRPSETVPIRHKPDEC